MKRKNGFILPSKSPNEKAARKGDGPLDLSGRKVAEEKVDGIGKEEGQKGERSAEQQQKQCGSSPLPHPPPAVGPTPHQIAQMLMASTPHFPAGMLPLPPQMFGQNPQIGNATGQLQHFPPNNCTKYESNPFFLKINLSPLCL
jgi:hypothetical protein